MIRLLLLVAAGTAVFAQGIASRGVQAQARPKASGVPWNAKFTNIAKEAGLTQVLHYGGTDRSDYVIETSSGGVALFDYDNDGLLDIFLVVGSKIENPPADAVSRVSSRIAARMASAVAVAEGSPLLAAVTSR